MRSAHYNVNRNYNANGLNQYTAAGAAAFCYDANGNLSADGGSVYLYDVENRLVEKRAQGSGNSNCAALSYGGALQAALRYDPSGRLYEVSGASGATRFLYDGDALTAEYDATGTLLRRYVHGADGAADDPIAWYEGSAFTLANQRVMRSDWQGSVVLVTDAGGNTVLAVNRYDEYGIQQSSNSGRFQYTGQAWIAELGMYYCKARIYSPTLGRFLQTDPIGYEDQVNLYAYVGNDPVDRIDPTGTSDLNLFGRDEDLFLAGMFFEPANRDSSVFTVTGHANVQGIADHRVAGGHYLIANPAALVRMAQANGYDRSQTLFLAGCNLATGNFASRVAQAAGGSVIAANGYVFFPSTAGGRGIDMTKPMSLRVNMDHDGHGPAGQFIRYDSRGAVVGTYDRATYNPNSGRVTFTGEARTGSLIRQSYSVCTDKKRAESDKYEDRVSSYIDSCSCLVLQGWKCVG